jgi:hypothetical protein
LRRFSPHIAAMITVQPCCTSLVLRSRSQKRLPAASPAEQASRSCRRRARAAERQSSARSSDRALSACHPHGRRRRQ